MLSDRTDGVVAVGIVEGTAVDCSVVGGIAAVVGLAVVVTSLVELVVTDIGATAAEEVDGDDDAVAKVLAGRVASRPLHDAKTVTAVRRMAVTQAHGR